MSSPKIWPRPFPYRVDYNDHFETPKIAYVDICPLLDIISAKSRECHCIYDPYFCNGRTKTLLCELGFSNVVHECRDFYQDIENDTIPHHDTFVSNPPYSDQHKEKCLEFVLEQLRAKDRPFFILMPNYVAAREYYRKLVEKVCPHKAQQRVRSAQVHLTFFDCHPGRPRRRCCVSTSISTLRIRSP